MDIFPSEIDTVSVIGDMDGEPVKMVRTIGGLYMAVSKKNNKDSVLGAGSHAAIVSYNIKKANPSIKLSLMKSESYSSAVVHDLTDLLSLEDRQKGYDLFKIEENGKATFSLSKFASEKGSVELIEKDGYLVCNKKLSADTSSFLKPISEAMVKHAAKKGMDIKS